VDALGLQNDRTGIVGPIPKLKAQARLAWFRDNHSASLSYNHQDSVAYDAIVQNALTGTPPPSNGRVRAWTITNAQYSYLFDGYLDSDINLSIGVNNLFDREPQRLPMLGGFASRLHTPWGRQFYMSVEWEPQS
jgi:outer membrane receptor protein involved in Fe transport